MSLIKLSGPLIETRMLVPVGGDDVVDYSWSMVPWLRVGAFAVRMDLLDKPRENPDHAQLESVPLPTIEEPDWDPEVCVSQWRAWRRQTWLHKYLEATTPDDRSMAALMMIGLDKL